MESSGTALQRLACHPGQCVILSHKVAKDPDPIVLPADIFYSFRLGICF